jgi:hypothetical protein
MLDADDSAKNRAADAASRHRRHFVFVMTVRSFFYAVYFSLP